MGSDDKQIDIYKRMPPQQRIAVGCRLHDFAHYRLVRFLKHRHPDSSPSDILKIAAKRFLGDTARVL